MKRLVSLLAVAAVTVVMAAAVFIVAPALPAQSDSFTLLEFNVMHGVPRPYIGTANPIRGINGGGLPWVLTSGKGELKSSGKLEVKVTGLVLDPNDPAVIASGNAGKNPVPNFRAIVSCLSVDSSGAAVTVNVTSDLFPATTGLAVNGGGNASFEGTLNLPSPCLAPIVFVTNPGSAWFATTGN